MRPARDIDDTISRVTKILTEEYGFRHSLEANSCLDRNGAPIPWYTYPAIEYLSQLDLSDKTVFEYGCGNSSLYWARIAKSVCSVESHKLWYAHFKEIAPANLTINLREGHTEYTQSIKNSGEKYDIIIIDGTFRDECAEQALSSLRSDGLIIFDNSDRAAFKSNYSAATALLRDSGLLQVDMHGFTPLNPTTATTSFFFTRSFQVKPLSESLPLLPIGGSLTIIPE